jgi:hypothetical protein
MRSVFLIQNAERNVMYTIIRRAIINATLLSAVVSAAAAQDAAAPDSSRPFNYVSSFRFDTIRLAIEDLARTFGDEYPAGQALLSELSTLERRTQQARDATKAASPWSAQELWRLRRELIAFRRRALLTNPALEELGSCASSARGEGVSAPGNCRG